MNRTNPQVDVYLSKAKQWREEFVRLRNIILGHELIEELKWGKPCYMFQESNLLILQGFKSYCALMFCKGALLKDAHGLLKKPGESTQAARQIRFTDVREIAELEPVLAAYIREAMEAERAGLKVEFKKNPEPVPDELQKQLEANAALKAAFQGLTPGRRRAYILHFSAPKQSRTRESRVEKCIPQILAGKGLNDE